MSDVELESRGDQKGAQEAPQQGRQEHGEERGIGCVGCCEIGGRKAKSMYVGCTKCVCEGRFLAPGCVFRGFLGFILSTSYGLPYRYLLLMIASIIASLVLKYWAADSLGRLSSFDVSCGGASG